MQIILIPALSFAWVVSMRADTIQLGKLSHSNVKVVGMQADTILYEMPDGRQIEKPLRVVTSVQIDGKPHFNRAETLMEAGQAQQALGKYDKAGVQATDSWMERLIAFRRLRALNQTEMVDRAVEQWLSVVDNSNPTAETLKLYPCRHAPPNAPENTAAIGMLQAKLATLEGHSPYRMTVQHCLLGLYSHESRVKEANELARKLLEATRTSSSDSDEDIWVRLQIMEQLIGYGQAESVLVDIRSLLRRNVVSRAQQPQAILVAGKAARILSESTEDLDKRQLLAAAGLGFMRVATYFPDTPQAAEALLLAGRVNAAMGNTWAATNAYRKVIQQYADSPAAKVAQAALEADSAKQPTGSPSPIDPTGSADDSTGLGDK